MTKLILIESPDGSERQLVSSTDGYEGWVILASDVDCPEDNHEWCKKDKCFKPNEKVVERRLRRRKMRDPDALLDIIDDLQARIARLEIAQANQGKKD